MAEPSNYYTVKNLAEIWKCSDQFIYNEMHAGNLGFFRLGKDYRIKPCHVAAYEEKNEVWPDQSLNSQIIDSNPARPMESTKSPGLNTVSLKAFQRGREIKARQNNSTNNFSPA